jgi:hypothetical protein
MTIVIKITQAGQPDMYVEALTSGAALFTGNPGKAAQFTADEAAEIITQLPVKTMPGVATAVAHE